MVREDSRHTDALGKGDTQKQHVIRHTRTRTGCERCRARRRKCDESKPRCGRCLDAGVVCQYLTRLSFLERNSQTLATASERPKYSAIQFVYDQASARDLLPTCTSPALGSLQPRQIADGGNGVPNGLVSLGHLAGREHPGKSSQESLLGDEEPLLGASNYPPSSDIAQLRAPTPGPSMTSHTIYLLKHYETNVSPWLDIFDLGRTFGLLVPQLAMTSPPVLDAVLQLSVISSGSRPNEAAQRNMGSVLLQHASLSPSEIPSFVALQILLSFVLSIIGSFIEAVPDAWEPIFVGGGAQPEFSMYHFTDTSHQRMWHGTVSLMSRLEIAYCLMHEVAPTWAPEVLRDIILKSSGSDDFQRVLNTSLHCLSLLGEVMGLCFEPSEHSTTTQAAEPAHPRGSRLDRWKAVLAELQGWYDGRPPELRSLAELENQETVFPTVLFTSSAGMSANVIYHMAMHLLLSHKPRAMPHHAHELDQDRAEAANTSPLWHSRRVCGIALTGKEQYAQCWDPCMIAAFFFAARRMTHQTQQRELLACLENVKTAGWRLDKLIHRLRREWGA
ncbi:hypothetical protein BGZ61DRAFT_589509 [Ilyonectria robusta]|uniref:uncharacterized protein n=1 Tax=Ilyonectria robusta TaxID=1079257 RepID=UPI001E8DAAB3|nr:uncharacterized protein BGZ61DRAFT_589509 [Ilyonectria robusta]KAH8686286.1 hypothetical protein BGZ61DRAFT_589509 [Ilyonectria robusta]